MASNGLVSRQTGSTMLGRQLVPSSDEWKKALQEVKPLYLRRRYKQCAAKATDLLRQFDGKLHPLHESYLHYYAAASYETLGHIAHNFSTNKLPLLYMAKDCYMACGSSLDIASLEFEEEQAKSDIPIGDNDVDDDVVSQASTCLHYSVLSDDDGGAATYSEEQRTTTAKNYIQEVKSDGGGPWDERDNPFRDATPGGRGNDDESHLSDPAKLIPPPLRVRKMHAKQYHDPLPESPTPQLYRRSMRPLPEPPVWAPLSTGNSSKSSRPSVDSCPDTQSNSLLAQYPAECCAKTTTTSTSSTTTPTTATTGATTPLLSTDSYSRPTRIVTQISSLTTQLAANIDSVTSLIEKTAELQRIHKATKNHRLASFWSFTPAFQTSAPGNNNNNGSGGSNSSSNGASSRSTSAGSSAGTKNTSVSGSSSATTSSTRMSGAAFDDRKKQRIERLRAEHWKTVGIRSPECGWKGTEYYERLCGVALAELYGY